MEAIFEHTLGREFVVRLESGPGVGLVTSRRAAPLVAACKSLTQAWFKVAEQSPGSVCPRRNVFKVKGNIQK
jgi:hypothetical protein